MSAEYDLEHEKEARNFVSSDLASFGTDVGCFDGAKDEIPRKHQTQLCCKKVTKVSPN